MLGHGFALFAGARQHHFIINKICAIGLPQQMVGAVDIFGVDRGHDETGRPTAQAFVIFGLVTCRLRRAVKIAGQAERIGKIANHCSVFRRRRHCRFQAGCCAAGKSPLHGTHAAFYARGRCTEGIHTMLLQHHHAKIEGNGIKASGKHNPRA